MLLGMAGESHGRGSWFDVSGQLAQKPRYAEAEPDACARRLVSRVPVSALGQPAHELGVVEDDCELSAWRYHHIAPSMSSLRRVHRLQHPQDALLDLPA